MPEFRNTRRVNMRRRRGVILPLLALLSIMLMVSVVMFVDVAYMQLTRLQLRAATDAAAKAACVAIAGGEDEATIAQAAIDVAALNEVGGKPLSLTTSDIELGSSVEQTGGHWKFTAGATPVTAVSVTGSKRDNSASGPVKLFFPHVFGLVNFTPEVRAVASQVEHEVMLCCDRSGSMGFDMSGITWSYPSGRHYCTQPHPVHSRWAKLEKAVDIFLETVEASNSLTRQTVGLVTWGSLCGNYCEPNPPQFAASTLNVPLGSNFDGIRDAMGAIGDYSIQGGTHMSSGLDKAIAALTGPDANPAAKKTIVLFTDGQWNMGESPESRCSIAMANGITIHVVSLLGHMAEMDRVASNTGGLYYSASTEAELYAAFRNLAKSLPVVLTE